jgi:hypothetical protein
MHRYQLVPVCGVGIPPHLFPLRMFVEQPSTMMTSSLGRPSSPGFFACHACPGMPTMPLTNPHLVFHCLYVLRPWLCPCRCQWCVKMDSSHRWKFPLNAFPSASRKLELCNTVVQKTRQRSLTLHFGFPGRKSLPCHHPSLEWI